MNVAIIEVVDENMQYVENRDDDKNLNFLYTRKRWHREMLQI